MRLLDGVSFRVHSRGRDLTWDACQALRDSTACRPTPDDMMKTSSKLWIGLGTVIAAGAGVAADGFAETSAAPALHVSGSFDIAQHAHGAAVKATPAKGQ